MFDIIIIKLALFDLDLTLLDSSKIVVEGINYACEKLIIQKLAKEEIYKKLNIYFP